MLIWVAALHCEARPVIDFYRLKKAHAKTPFDIYRGDEMTCVVSGIGKVASAAACGWLAGASRDAASLAWINLGCAGAALHEIGAAFTLDKITDADSGQSYYPASIAPSSLPFSPCLTLSRPGEDYREDTLFDMEASGFVYSALRFSSAELVQAIKVVSDNRERQTGKNREAVSQLIAAHIESIDEQAMALLELNREVASRALPADEWRRLESMAHFSQTQQSRLRVLWLYLRNRDHSADDLLRQLSGLASAGAIIDALQDMSRRDSEAL